MSDVNRIKELPLEAIVKLIQLDPAGLRSALYEVCEDVHASCDSSCPVYAVAEKAPGSGKSFPENHGCDCFKNGGKMLEYLRQHLLPKQQAEEPATDPFCI